MQNNSQRKISVKHAAVAAMVCSLAAAGLALAAPATSPTKPPAVKPAATAPATNSPTVAPKQQAADTTPNAIAKGFSDKGVVSCTARINQVTNFVGSGGATGAFLFLPPPPQDQRLASTSIEVVDKDKKSVYVSSSFAPNQANGCAAVYDAVAWWPAKCDAVASSQFPGQKQVGIIKQNIAILEINAVTRVFLMPAGEGCISIKKEVVSQ